MPATALHMEKEFLQVFTFKWRTHADVVSVRQKPGEFRSGAVDNYQCNRKQRCLCESRVTHTDGLTRALTGAGDKRPYNDRARTRAIIPARIVVIAEKRTIDSICSEYKVSGWKRLRACEKAGRISKRARVHS